MNNIYLIGFMGTGKTVVGNALAVRIGRKFFDLDELIEKRQGRSISEIFNTEGEAFFRGLETDMLREVSRENRCIVACGGGAVIAEANRAVMCATGTMVCLNADPDTILARTAASSRPLLQVKDPKKAIIDLLEQRRSFYAQAEVSVETAGRGVEDIVAEIASLFGD